MEKHFTKQGLEKLKKELENLEKVKRKEVVEKIKYAAAQGDLRENAGYAAAKEEQMFIEERIKELRAIIAQARVIDKHFNGKIGLGSTIFLKTESGEEKYQIVNPEEADILSGKISIKSPFGKAFLGKKQGDMVEVKVPAGKTRYRVIKIK